MNSICNVDTGYGKIRFSYRISLVVNDSTPIFRMMDTLRANSEINEWVSKYRLRWNFSYKIDDNMLYVDTKKRLKVKKANIILLKVCVVKILISGKKTREKMNDISTDSC